MIIRTQYEAWSDVVKDLKPLVALQYAEIALDQEDIQLDPNWSHYSALAQEGMLATITARCGNCLVGWHVSVVTRHPHYQSTLVAMQDLYYVLPQFRADVTLGLRLFRCMEDEMLKRGVKLMIGNTKCHLDRSPMFDRLGWRKTAITYSKVLR